jgi:hypothetical protein
MSSGGQVVGGIVGAVAGFFIPGAGALIGAQVGMMIGGYLDPPKGPTIEGPRLDDLSVQTSTYGAVIPRLYGMVTVTGNVFWLENNRLKETVKKSKSGGKGGGSKAKTRTYSYSATFAVGLCKGPIAGVRRLWVGPDLIYDAGSSDPDTIAASNAAADGFAIYLGTSTQDPDARMQATLGAANTPAWRGLAYLVFYDLALARYANSLAGAQVRAEVIKQGAAAGVTVARHDMPHAENYKFTAWNGSLFVRLANFESYVWTSPDGVTWTRTATAFTASCNWKGLAYGNGVFVAPSAVSGSPKWVSSDGINWTSHLYAVGNENIAFGNGVFVYPGISVAAVSATGTSWAQYALPYNSGGNGSYIAFNGTIFLVVMPTSNKAMVSSNGVSWTGVTPNGTPLTGNHRLLAVKNGEFLIASTLGATAKKTLDGITWTDVPSPPYYGSLSADETNYYCFGTAGFAVSPDGVSWTTYPSFVGALTYSAPCWNGSVMSVANDGTAYAYLIQNLSSITPITPPLSDVVSAECLQSGLLSSGDIDVSALTPTVWGYKIGSVGAIRAALEPLQAAWPFDVIQAGYLIKFVLRGGSSVATIAAADLDARASGAAPGVQITTSREMDSQLPRRITLRHLEEAREYDSGEQYAERLNTPAINTRLIDLPIVLTATEAAGKAEVLLYLAWLERHDVSFVLPPTYNLLEPGDSVTLTTHEGAILLRLTAVNYTSDGRIECQAKYASAAIYTPTAVGVAGTVTGTTTITRVGGARAVLMDVPVVTNEQNEPCYLAAMYGDLSGWTGGVLMTSVDGGTTWTEVESFDGPGATVGIATNTISAPSEYGVVDTRSQLEITIQNGELFSITEPEMFARGNMLAYGVDGRWEIIGARTITQISGANYRLGDMIRGRSGTEWAASLHEIGDTVVLLDSSDVALIKVDPAAIGASRLYRAVTYDRDISTATNIEFTYRAINLKPLAGHAGAGLRDATTLDWRISVRRRSRIIDEWRDYVDIDVGESPEAYQFDICEDDTYAVVKRTVNGELVTRGADYTYTAAEQIEDFGVEQNTVSYVAYMMSSVVGRGYPMYRTYTRTFG